MKVSKLIKKLTELQQKYGDHDVFFEVHVDNVLGSSAESEYYDERL